MRDEDDRPLEADDGLLEDLGGGDVEVVGRLVEEQEVARLEQELRQGEPRALAAREAGDDAQRVVAPEAEAREVHARGLDAEVAADACGSPRPP